MQPDEFAYITIRIPKTLRERCRVLYKKTGVKFVELVRNALSEHVAYLEAKQRIDEERLAEAKASTVNRKQVKTITPLGESPLRPLSKIASVFSQKTEVDEKLAPLLAKHARLIAEASNFAYERRMRLAEAVADIKKAAPLTHPPEGQLMLLLENMAGSALLQQPSVPEPEFAPPPEVAPDVVEEGDENVEMIIDPSKLRSFGDV
jgi:hypothetical protein